MDNRDDRAARIRATVRKAIDELPSNNSSPSETLADQIKALKVLASQGLISWDDVELLTVGLKSSYSCIQRCRQGLPLEMIKDHQFGINIVKPI
jgi:hypothetical protein